MKLSKYLLNKAASFTPQQLKSVILEIVLRVEKLERTVDRLADMDKPDKVCSCLGAQRDKSFHWEGCPRSESRNSSSDGGL